MEGKKILLVEDEEAQQEVLKKKLIEEGYTVKVAMNGKEAIEKAESFQPDLILMDIIMPVMDGLTALRKLKAEDSTKDIPVIMLTNLSGEEEVEVAMQEGVHDYLIKTDWALGDILKEVKKKLG